ncbi:MAG: Ig-like domain-containing protein [Flavobacteriia bacterium]|nr:Ig-like domain-containing protein [Flavobacteriia bacterium]
MVKYLFLSLFLFLLYSCAQIGDISGGEKDVTAPKIISCNPPNKSVYFTEKKIEFTFDEYIKLNNPNDNAIILPFGAKLKVTAKKKKMRIEWGDELLPNSSYQINMNSLVKDIKEGNDSVMTYVFSTGAFLDSLSLKGVIIDVESNSLQEGWTVFLNNTDDILQTKPTYFVKTNKKGEFKIENIKEGKYFLYAIKDESKDLLFQRTEGIAFMDSFISIYSTDSAQIVLNSFKNLELPKIKTKKYISPNLLILSTTFPISQSKLYLDSVLVKNENIKELKEDSVVLVLDNALIPANHQLVFQYGDTKDTTTFFVSKKEEKLSYIIFPTDKKLVNKKEVEFLFNAPIISINTALIESMTTDSISIPFTYQIDKTILFIYFSDTLNKNVSFTLKKDAISFENNQDMKEIKTNFILKSEKDFATLILKNKIPEKSILEIKNSNVKLLYTDKKLNENLRIEKLEPGEYSVRLILDENGNEKWDTGDFFKRQQAEKILFFNDKIKLRANWETEIEIDFELKTIK